MIIIQYFNIYPTIISYYMLYLNTDCIFCRGKEIQLKYEVWRVLKARMFTLLLRYQIEVCSISAYLVKFSM